MRDDVISRALKDDWSSDNLIHEYAKEPEPVSVD
jgi:hypothetical protein